MFAGMSVWGGSNGDAETLKLNQELVRIAGEGIDHERG
jgi:hypothetical protein